MANNVGMNTSNKREEPSNKQPETPRWVEILRTYAPIVDFGDANADANADASDDASDNASGDANGEANNEATADTGEDTAMPCHDNVLIMMDPISEDDASKLIERLDKQFGRHSKPVAVLPKTTPKTTVANHAKPNWYDMYSSSTWLDARSHIADLPHVEVEPCGVGQWAVILDEALLCVCAYERGARAVQRVITEMGRRYVIASEQAAAAQAAKGNE